MNFRVIITILSCSIFLTPITSFTKTLTFGGRTSTFKISSGATLNLDQNLTTNNAIDGTIWKESTTANITPATDKTITFDKGVLESGTSESFFSGKYDPAAANDTIKLESASSSSPHRFRAEPGTVVQHLEVSNTYNTIEGQPLFTYDLRINDGATLNMGVQNKLNKTVNLNYNSGTSGGTLKLIDDLRLHDDVVIQGRGTVNLNNRTLELPGDESTWTTSLTFYNATDMELHAKTSLTNTWSFDVDGDDYHAYLNGNGNILDLSSCGILWVEPKVHLHLVDVTIKGLGSGAGSIILAGNGANQSRLYLHNSKISLAANYSVTCGGWYVEGGDSTIIAADKVLTFNDDVNGTLTVDGVTLWYDTMNYGDNENVSPSEAWHATNNPEGPITLSNGGIIKNTEELGFEGDILIQNPTDSLYKHHDITDNHKLVFKKLDDDPDSSKKTITLDGGGYSLRFPRESSTEFLRVDDANGDLQAVTQNIVLEDFDSTQVTVDSGSTLTFGTGTTIELGVNDSLAKTLNFSGSCIFDGKDHILDMSDGDAKIYIMASGSVLFKNITIKGLSGTNSDIQLADNTSAVSFENVTWIQAGDYAFDTGKFDVTNGIFKLQVGGNATNDEAKFEYSSTVTSTVHTNAIMYLDRNMTFSYNCQWADMFALEDASSVLYLNIANIDVSNDNAGLTLTKGTMVIDNHCEFTGGTSDAKAIRIGDGVEANDLTLEVMAGGILDAISGHVKYDNVS